MPHSTKQNSWMDRQTNRGIFRWNSVSSPGTLIQNFHRTAMQIAKMQSKGLLIMVYSKNSVQTLGHMMVKFCHLNDIKTFDHFKNRIIKNNFKWKL